MGASTHVVGFKPIDEKWQKMKAVLDACIAAGIEAPNEVGEFFGHEAPDPAGVEIKLEGTDCCAPVTAEMQDGFEIDVTKLPPGVSLIRFYNSY